MPIAARCTSEENDEGIVADQTKAATEIELDQKALKELEITMELEYSFKLFRSLTTLTYFNRDSCLISGSCGMVHTARACTNNLMQIDTVMCTFLYIIIIGVHLAYFQ
jgi:hypothetical protein